MAEPSAGAHHGASFVPRLGDEVLVEYAHGDIDQPIVVGQLYNGQAAPVFAAGEGSGANHPGTLSGIQTQTLDGQAASRWVLDDASGQLRHSLMNTVADSQLNLGYLIDQQGNQRGGYRVNARVQAAGDKVVPVRGWWPPVSGSALRQRQWRQPPTQERRRTCRRNPPPA